MFESFSDSVMEVVNQIKGMDFRTAWSNLASIAASAASVAENADAIVDSQRAGIGANILFISREKLAKKTLTDENRPDYIIHRFIDVLDLPILQKGGDRA